MPDIPIRDHLEELNRERMDRIRGIWEAHEAVHVQEGKAREEAAKRIDARLVDLNELRREVTTDRERFVSREAFQAKMEAQDTRIDALHDQITEWRGREKGLSLVASIAVGTAGFIAAVLAIYFALN